MSKQPSGITLTLPRRGKKKEIRIETSTIGVSSQQIVQQSIYNIPIFQQLSKINGIQPYLIKSLIPDLIYLYTTKGEQNLVNAIQLADPNNPPSIIFNHPFQKVHEQTLKIETEMILDEPETIERDDIQCNCGSKRVQTRGPIQTRGGDEPGTIFARCVTCRRQWRFSAA